MGSGKQCAGQTVRFDRQDNRVKTPGFLGVSPHVGTRLTVCGERGGFDPAAAPESRPTHANRSGPRLAPVDAVEGLVLSVMAWSALNDAVARIWENLGGRVSGPLSFRLILQPMMAAILATRAGIQDARAGRPPYLWTILMNAHDRAELLREGWKAVARIFALAVIMDVPYQMLELRWVYPIELLIVAVLLACVPYVLVRGLVSRIVTTMSKEQHRRL
jgi:hypothetical protein